MSQDYSVKIAPTAHVASDASLGVGVSVGHGAIIESGAVIGDHCKIMSYAFVSQYVKMGTHNLIGHGALIGGDPQDISSQVEERSWVQIGDHNKIREYATIHRALGEECATLVGNYNFLMVGAHLGHNVQLGNHVIVTNNVLLAGHVRVDDRAVLGGGSVFHQYIRVGELAMVQGGSRFSQDIPPYLVAAGFNEVFGLNLVGLRRACVTAEDRKIIKQVFHDFYHPSYSRSEALKQLKKSDINKKNPYFQKILTFFQEPTAKGICSRRKGKK